MELKQPLRCKKLRMTLLPQVLYEVQWFLQIFINSMTPNLWGFFYFHVFVSVACVCMYTNTHTQICVMWAHVYAGVCVCNLYGSLRVRSWISLNCSPTLFSEAGYLSQTQNYYSFGQLAHQIFLFSTFWDWNYKWAAIPIQHLSMFRGFEPWSSCLYSKYLKY